jgi:glycosyltransferase involved in cell wall biosynthesis
MKILHILNSDFGNANTMGYRSFQIYKYSSYSISAFCRNNLSEIVDKNIKKPFPFYREYSRFAQLMAMINKNILIFKKIEIFLFDYFAKKNIDSSDIVHFFHHSPELIKYAKSKNKVVILEAFTHPLYLEKMFNDGLKLDYNTFTPDLRSIESFELTDFIISPSKWVTKTLLHATLKSDKIFEINYGVHFQDDKINYDKDDKLSIVFAGGLKRTKGIIELLKAINKLPNLNIKVNIFGRMYNDIKDEVELLKTDTIEFHGFTKNIIEEYKKNDLYVYPTYFEGSSKTVFEAMSCGLPVITTENAGSIVRDGLDGFIVPVNDINCLAEKIKYFHENRKQIEIMGRNGQEYSKEYTWKRYGIEVNNIYKKVLNNED